MHGQPVSEPHTHVHYYRLALILGALTAIGPLAIDMYLPALPTIAREFGAAASVVQSSLAAYFIGIAIGQAFYGPLLGSAGPQADPVPGTGALHGLVDRMRASRKRQRADRVPISSGARRLRADRDSAGRSCAITSISPGSVRMLSVLMLVMGLAPILAPLIGGQLLVHFGWRAVFWLLTAYAATWLAVVAIFLPESLPSARRVRHPIKDVLRVYWRLARDRKFMGHALSGALIFAGLLAYISGSPVVFIELFDVPPERYGVYFGINAVGIIAASQINRWLVGRVETHRIVSIVLRGGDDGGRVSRARCVQRIRRIRRASSCRSSSTSPATASFCRTRRLSRWRLTGESPAARRRSWARFNSLVVRLPAAWWAHSPTAHQCRWRLSLLAAARPRFSPTGS